MLLTFYAEFRRQQRQRIQLNLHMDELPKLNEFMHQFSSQQGWNTQMTTRLQAVAEETMQILVESREGIGIGQRKHLVVDVTRSGQTAELEFKSGARQRRERGGPACIAFSNNARRGGIRGAGFGNTGRARSQPEVAEALCVVRQSQAVL